MTEQQATDELETIVGSVDKCFRLMRIYQDAVQSASGNRFAMSFGRKKLPTVQERFAARAKDMGYSSAAINHYLEHIV